MTDDKKPGSGQTSTGQTSKGQTQSDRGATVSEGAGGGWRRHSQLLVAGTIGVVGLVALGVIARSALSRPATAETQKKSEQKFRHEAPDTPRSNAKAVDGAPATHTPAQPAALPPVPSADPLLEAAQRAPVTAYSRTLGIGQSASGGDAGALEPTHSEDNGAFERRFKSPVFAGAKAGLIGDRRFIVAQGMSIPCVMETAMQSDQAGFVSCVIPRDVLSDNGQVVLMEKGTQVVGEYRGGLQQGQTRLHVLWSRAKTPAGVVVDLDSAATDALGRAGVGGTVDTHFWERMSAAMLLSVVSDVSGFGSSRLQKAAGVQSNAVGQAPNSAAAVAVEQTAAIKPTLHKKQGEMVSIFVARDLDFSGVYALKVVQDTGAWRDSPHLEEPVTGIDVYSGRLK